MWRPFVGRGATRLARSTVRPIGSCAGSKGRGAIGGGSFIAEHADETLRSFVPASAVREDCEAIVIADITQGRVEASKIDIPDTF